MYRHAKRHSGPAVIFSKYERELAGRAILQELKKHDVRLLALAVAGMHAHLLIELPDDVAAMRRIIGRCKTAACYALRDRKPGRVWASYGGYKPVDDEDHHRNVFQYVLGQENAWTWSFKDEETACS